MMSCGLVRVIMCSIHLDHDAAQWTFVVDVAPSVTIRLMVSGGSTLQVVVLARKDQVDALQLVDSKIDDR